MKTNKTQKIPREAISYRTIPICCCHCGNIFKISKWKVDEGKKTGVSHGLCPACYEKELEKAIK